jgi:hypothetical protein
MAKVFVCFSRKRKGRKSNSIEIKKSRNEGNKAVAIHAVGD